MALFGAFLPFLVLELGGNGEWGKRGMGKKGKEENNFLPFTLYPLPFAFTPLSLPYLTAFELTRSDLGAGSSFSTHWQN
jgi:hypothetical protein